MSDPNSLVVARREIGLWELQSYDAENVLLHADRIPAEIAWMGEKFAYLSRLVEDLENDISSGESAAFLRAKGVTYTQTKVLKGGKVEKEYFASDDVAKHMSRTDETVLELKRTLSRVREIQQRLKFYINALEKKSVLVAGMVGIVRDEYRLNQQRGGGY